VPGGPVHLPEGKPMLCFSPHPDDDVISMGATMKRLVEYGNDLHVAYMTSGNIAVSDDFVSQMIEFWSDLNHAFQCDSAKSADLEERVRAFLASKAPGDVDSPEVQEIKGQIRRSEALAACRWMDIPPAHAHFLNLPFYQTGQVRKRPIGHDDVRIVLELIREVRPRWVFMAGEMADPHGTHRLCAEAIFAALRECRPEERPDAVWLYRGAWQEWDPHVIDMAIPFSRSELTHKIFGIFKHQSQKDKALFPGPYDDREFWQRAEARNTESASLYNRLGLPEHYAMEAFVRYEAS
jgi:glucosamine-6-phosphate deaminase